MELFHLRYFCEAAKHQNITKSAKLLHVSQPALSQAISKLEAELGVSLFESSGRGIKLTVSGQYFYRELQPLMYNLKELLKRIKSMSDKDNVVVHLNILAAWTLVAQAVMEYQRIDNELQVELIQERKTQQADISVSTQQVYQLQQSESADLVYVCTEKIFLAVPNIPRFYAQTAISLKEVENENFITLASSKDLRSICDAFCTCAGITPRIVFESDSPSAVKNMISSNMGIGFWPEFSWGKINRSRMRLLKITDMPCSRDIIITCHHKDNMHVTLFYDFLVKYFELCSQNS